MLCWRIAGRESGWFSTAESGGVGAALGGATVFAVATTLKVLEPLADVLIVFDAGASIESGGKAEDSIVAWLLVSGPSRVLLWQQVELEL